MNQSPILFRLQNIDLHIDKINRRLDEILRMKNSDKTIGHAEEKLHSIEQNLKDASDALTKIEKDLEAIQTKLNRNEASLYRGNISNPKELQDLQIENDSLKKRIEAMENSQLDAMLILESVEQDFSCASQGLDQAKADLSEKHAGWNGEQSDLNSQKDTLLMERSALVGSIVPENLQLYEKLRVQKRGVAIACIEENTCGACGSEIRPAELQIARLPSQMAFCSSCGRILYTG